MNVKHTTSLLKGLVAHLGRVEFLFCDRLPIDTKSNGFEDLNRGEGESFIGYDLCFRVENTDQNFLPQSLIDFVARNIVHAQSEETSLVIDREIGTE